MDSTKHSRRRKHSHSHHHQTVRRSEKFESNQEVQEPVFGKEFESGRGSELRKYAQNVLGRYDDYQSAVRKMDMNEQMYGVAELTPSSKPHPPVSSKVSQIVQPMFNVDLKKEKLKKQQQVVVGVGEHDLHSVSESAAVSALKKKVSVPPYKGSCQIVSSKPTISSNSLNKFPSSTAVTGISTNTFTQSSSSIPKKSKVKKPKKSKSTNSHDSLSSVSTNISSQNVIPTSKPRPEALSLPVAITTDAPPHSDTPDTGDVRHMLQELLHPKSFPLVTPIPTPNKVQPFVFPNQFSTHEMLHSDPSLPSTDLYKHPNNEDQSPASSTKPATSWVLSSSGSSSGASSSASTPSEFSSSPSSSSTCSTREHGPVDFHEEERERCPPAEDRARFTLERLQQQIASSNMAAITPLKKTPPHSVCREELANLSPAKSCKPILTQNDSILSSLAHQSSLGFHPVPVPTPLDAEEDEKYSYSSSDSNPESDPDMYTTPNRVMPNVESFDQHLVHTSTQLVGHVHQPFSAVHQSLLPKSHRKKDPTRTTKKHKLSVDLCSNKPALLESRLNEAPEVNESASQATASDALSSLLVKIPLVDLRLPKPKATVEPYIIRTTTPSSSRPLQRNTTTELEEMGQGREHYASRLHNVDFGTGLLHDYHGGRGERARLHTRWERENAREHRGTSRLSGRGHGWERDHYRGSGDDYWSDNSSRAEVQRGVRSYPRTRDPEYFMQEARRRKKDADKIIVPGLEKAKLYMESVTYFMRHGGAIENEQQDSSTNAAMKKNPYKMYSDTISIIKYCQNMAGECKPLLVLCLRCQSALYWRMFLIKQHSTTAVHKELQEFFVSPKGNRSKSPFLGSLSPLPSPASVGSTASTSSAGASTSHLTDSSVALPRHIYNKTSEHIAVSNLIYACLELWQLSDAYMQQCREFFLNADRKAGLTIHYYSPVFQVASWVEDILKSF